MDYEQSNLDALNKVISVQNELITFLKAEVERLKASQVVVNPSPVIQPYSPGTYPLPTYPWPGNPQQPYYPWYGDVITSSGTPPMGSGGITSTFTFPPGSVQSSSHNFSLTRAAMDDASLASA